MIHALIAKLTGRDGSRAMLAGLAVAWGMSTLTGLADARQDELTELDAAIDAKRGEITALERTIDDLWQQLEQLKAELTSASAAAATPPADPAAPAEGELEHTSEVTDADLDSWAADHAGGQA